jgi:hypothetical protein
MTPDEASPAAAPDPQAAKLELICYLHPGWKPLIRPASPKRDWMDATPESFAYRCLPLNIANAHGWEVLSSCSFEASWDGGTGTEAVSIRLPEGADPVTAPVSIFGQGVLTFHVAGLFRTPPGWNLWVGGSPNSPRDGIAPLGGVIETDWSPFTFTMNWRFTRPDNWVRFEAGEAVAFLFPVQRDALERFTTRFAQMQDDPKLMAQFEAWSRSRNAFQDEMRLHPPNAPSAKWQKHYYRGVDPLEQTQIEDHRTKLRLAAFEWPASYGSLPAPSAAACPVSHAAASPKDQEIAALRAQLDRMLLLLRKRDWILDVAEGQRALSPRAAGIEKRTGLSQEEFLQRFYAAGRPVVLAGELADWPALKLWTPDYLKAAVGEAVVEFQGARLSDADYELNKEAHRREAPFSVFIDQISRPGAGNDAYLTAFNSAKNLQALVPLAKDMGFLDRFLVRAETPLQGMPWIGPQGAFTPLHHDLTNNLIVQVTGRKTFKFAPPSETWRLYNGVHVFSAIGDIENRERVAKSFPAAVGARFYDVTLEPGDALFLPVGWWHQARALDFSVTFTHTNFLWPNKAAESYPTA